MKQSAKRRTSPRPRSTYPSSRAPALGDPAKMVMLRSIAAGERQPGGPLALMVRSWDSSLCNG